MKRQDSREIQKKAEFFVFNVHSPDPKMREKAWEVGLELFHAFLPLIKKIVLFKTNRMNVDPELWASTIKREGVEDMISEGKVRFFEGLYHYDPSSGVYFTHYIRQKIQYGIFNTLRDQKSFDHAMNSILIEDIEQEIADEEEEEEQITNKHLALRVAWNGLDSMQRNVLDLTIMKNYTLREAGEELGIHFTTVRLIKKRSLNQMKKILKKFVMAS